MTCDECEALLIDASAGRLRRPEAVEAHLKSCPSCAAFDEASREVLALAALPPLGPDDERLLASLPEATLARYAEREKRRTFVRRAAPLALAAGIGALLATAALTLGRPVPSDTSDLAWAELAEMAEPEVAEPELGPLFEWAALEVGWTTEAELDLTDVSTDSPEEMP